MSLTGFHLGDQPQLESPERKPQQHSIFLLSIATLFTANYLWWVRQSLGQGAEVRVGAGRLLGRRSLGWALARRTQVFRTNRHAVLSARGQSWKRLGDLMNSASILPHFLTRYCVPVDARGHCAHFHVVYANHVLVVRVGRQPGDDGRGAGDIARPHSRRAQVGRVPPDDHRAGRVPGRPSVLRHAADADPVWLMRVGGEVTTN